MPLNEDVAILSVQFSGIGLATLDALPNLRWIVYRSSAVKADPDKLALRGIRVVASHPSVENVSLYVLSMIGRFRLEPPFAILGGGRIGREILSYLPTTGTVFGYASSTHERADLAKQLENFSTIICAASYHSYNEGYMDAKLLSRFSGSIVSVSDKRFFNDKQIAPMVRCGKIRYLIADMLNEEKYPDCMTVVHTHHTAWKHKMDEKQYWTVVKLHIDAIRNGTPIGIVTGKQETWPVF